MHNIGIKIMALKILICCFLGALTVPYTKPASLDRKHTR